MTTLYPTISKDLILPYGEEGAVGSVYKWFSDVFSSSYAVYFDKDNAEFTNRTLTKFPCIVVQQIDTQDLTQNFTGGKNNLAGLLFYVYFNHSLKDGGSRRLLRRGRDQIMFALKMAGVTNANGDMVVPPIYMYDFSGRTPVKIDGVVSVMGGIQQRFLQEDDTLQAELMVTFKYMEKLI